MKTSYSAADRIRALVHVVDVAITIGVSLALLSAVAGTARGASAPQPSPARDVSGYVLDEQTGEALPYAGVKLRGTRIGAFTNLDGHFVLVGVPAPACTLEVSFVGYEDERMIVPATDGDTARVVVQMVPTTFEQEGIVVYGDRYQMWKAAEHVGQMTLSARDISDLPALGEVDIFRSLQLLPGISAVGDGSAGLYVRGGTPDQNLVMLDGMTVYHVDHFFGIFSAFNADAIKDIQVFKGGFPARYGGRLSSVVELTGKTGDAKQARYSFGGNFLSAHAVAEVPLFGNGSWLISARRSYTDIVRSDLYNNLFNLATGDDGTSTTTPQIGRGRGGGRFAQQESVPDFYFYDVNSKMTFAPTTDDVLAFSFYAGKDNLSDITETGGLGFRFDSQSEIQLTGALRQEDVTDWGNLGASLKWSRQWGPRFYSNLLFAQSTYSSTQGNSRSFVSEDGSVVDTTSGFRGFSSFLSEESNHVRDVSLKMDNEWHIASRHRIGFGAWISQVGTDYRAAVNDTLVRVDRESTSVLASAYVEDRWKLTRSWEFTPGLRVSHYDQTERFYVEPRASLSWRLTDQVTLRGAWGHYYQFVNRVTNENVLEGSRDFWLVADDEIPPGYAQHFTLGASYENNAYLFEVEGYRKNLDNLMEFTRRYRRREAPENYFYFGSGVAEGVEFLAQKKAGIVTGWMSYTLGRVEYEFPDFNSGDPFPASHDRTHEFKTVGIYKAGPWTFSGTWVYATGKAYTAPESQYFIELLDGESQSYIHVGEQNGNRLPEYHRLDVSASANLVDFGLPSWDVGFSVLNLYDRQNVSYRRYDLDVTPILETDVSDLGYTPTIFIKAAF